MDSVDSSTERGSRQALSTLLGKAKSPWIDADRLLQWHSSRSCCCKECSRVLGNSIFSICKGWLGVGVHMESVLWVLSLCSKSSSYLCLFESCTHFFADLAASAVDKAALLPAALVRNIYIICSIKLAPAELRSNAPCLILAYLEKGYKCYLYEPPVHQPWTCFLHSYVSKRKLAHVCVSVCMHEACVCTNCMNITNSKLNNVAANWGHPAQLTCLWNAFYSGNPFTHGPFRHESTIAPI